MSDHSGCGKCKYSTAPVGIGILVRKTSDVDDPGYQIRYVYIQNQQIISESSTDYLKSLYAVKRMGHKVGLSSLELERRSFSWYSRIIPRLIFNRLVSDKITGTGLLRRKSGEGGDKLDAYRPKSFTFNQSVATNTRFRRENSVLK